LVSLCKKVASDGGSDIIFVGRKIAENGILVEIRGIRRNNTDVLTQSEINDFISDRSSIVQNAKIGQEFRNEPTSKVIVGGRKNKMYVAWPSKKYDDFREDGIDSWPYSIVTRMFGNDDNSVEVGSIFPYWGLAPDDQTPMAEPYLSLDHVSFSQTEFANKLPLLKIDAVKKTVRTIQTADEENKHETMFIEGDGESDQRPFGVVSDTILLSHSRQPGYIRGIPLNDDVLAAALVSKEMFFLSFYMYYPQTAESLMMPRMDFSVFNNITDPSKWDKFAKTDPYYLISNDMYTDDQDELDKIKRFNTLIYEWVRDYADDHLGRQFLVCLPKSIIMGRIWNDLSVPTRIDKPSIEYMPDNAGYWEVLPSELDGIMSEGESGSEEYQVRHRFMAEDGRFQSMAVINTYPEGNGSFWADGEDNEVLLQDLPISDFRPNKITGEDPSRVYVALSHRIIPKRPDVLIASIPRVRYNPRVVEKTNISDPDTVDRDAWLFNKATWLKFFNYVRIIDPELNGFLNIFTDTYKGKIINAWAETMSNTIGSLYGDRKISTTMEMFRVIDLEAVLIPLTSTWVSYGPWYETADSNRGMLDIMIDDSLVPWNFARPEEGNWDSNLNEAGEEILERNTMPVEWLDKADITVAGFPEFGLGQVFGYNSNLTSINVNFAVGGITTDYTFSTYSELPGTFRKFAFDNIAESRVDNRPKLDETVNINLKYENLYTDYTKYMVNKGR